MTENTDTPGPEPAHSAFRVLAALADLGAANAAAIAERAGLGYSTVTPKLRAWESSGHAEKYRQAHTDLLLWRLTPAGRATTGVETSHRDSSPAEPESAQAPPVHAVPDEPTPPEVPSIEADTAAAHHGNDAHDDDEQPAADAAATETTPTASAAQFPPNPSADVADNDAPPAEKADEDGDDAAAAAVNGDSAAPQPVAKRKRPAGALEASVLAILQSRPDETFKVNDLRKLVDKADEGTGYPAASAGAISNALTKLTGKGDVDTVQEKPATFQAAPGND